MYKIDTNSCGSCGMCVEECPQNAIEIKRNSGYGSPFITDNCVSCGRCAEICPMECISLATE